MVVGSVQVNMYLNNLRVMHMLVLWFWLVGGVFAIEHFSFYIRLFISSYHVVTSIYTHTHYVTVVFCSLIHTLLL